LLATLCVGVRAGAADSAAALRQQLEADGIDASKVVIPFELSPEIRAWVRQHSQPSLTINQELADLLAYLQDQSEKHLVYKRGYTGTASEVFATSKFNCLGFSYLFVGIARELGIDAYFLKMERIRRFGRQGGYIIVSGHMTAGYGAPTQRVALEFGAADDPTGYATGRMVSDREAVALYYSNRGTELLRQGRPRDALDWMQMAVKIDPQLPDAWVNLGVIQRRLHQLDAAEASYRRAIQLDSNQISAYYNLSILLRLRGDTDAFRRLIEIVDQRTNKNPYTFLALGDLSMNHGDLEDAFQYYRRAFKLKRNDVEIQAALGMWAIRAGELQQAEKWLRKARNLNADNERVQELADRIKAAVSTS
jgi:Flp pilus assembly protein TadD